MWQNGNVGVDELQGRLKMCVQQAICDLVTEFGLLTNSLFENLPIKTSDHSLRSKVLCNVHAIAIHKMCILFSPHI